MSISPMFLWKQGKSNQDRWEGLENILYSFVNMCNTSYDFLELYHFFDDPVDVGNVISGFSAFSKTNLNIWKFTVHTLLKPGLENFEHYYTNVWDECNCVVVWAFFGIAK